MTQGAAGGAGGAVDRGGLSRCRWARGEARQTVLAQRDMRHETRTESVVGMLAISLPGRILCGTACSPDIPRTSLLERHGSCPCAGCVCRGRGALPTAGYPGPTGAGPSGGPDGRASESPAGHRSRHPLHHQCLRQDSRRPYGSGPSPDGSGPSPDGSGPSPDGSGPSSDGSRAGPSPDGYGRHPTVTARQRLGRRKLGSNKAIALLQGHSNKTAVTSNKATVTRLQ